MTHFMVVWALSAAASASRPPPSCTFVHGMDVGAPSTIIRHLPSVSTDDDCCAACVAEDACAVAILFPPSSSVKGCWLKDGTGENTTNADASLCRVAGRMPHPWGGVSTNLTLLPNSTAGRCMDGSPGGYYLAANTSSKVWVINLEGGGECASQKNCDARRGSPLFSSKYFSPHQDPSNGGYITSADPANPLHYANRVFIPYCSQDLWTGQRTSPSSDTWGYYFAGHLIIEAVLNELDALGLAHADTIILSGESAGGIGVWPNLDYVADRYPSARVIGVPIAGFYFFAYPYMGPNHTQVYDAFSMLTRSGLADFREEAWPSHYALWQSYVDKDCAAAIEPWRCVLANNTFPYIKSEAFIVESNVDKVVTTAHDWVPNEDPKWSADVLAYFRAWQQNMTIALAPSMAAHSKNGVFNPACFIHTDFSESSPIIQGKSYLTALAGWLAGTPTKLQDTCGILCNPSCPH